MSTYWHFNENVETENFDKKWTQSETNSLNIFSLWLPLIGQEFSESCFHPCGPSLLCMYLCLHLCLSVPALKERLLTEPVVICLFDLKQKDSPQLCGLLFGEQFKGWVLCRWEIFYIIVAPFYRLAVPRLQYVLTNSKQQPLFWLGSEAASLFLEKVGIKTLLRKSAGGYDCNTGKQD